MASESVTAKRNKNKGKGKGKGKARSGQKSKARRRSARAERAVLTASTADRFDLYQRSVQDADQEVQFLAKTYAELRGAEARHFREDFCGTALTAATWVEQGPGFTAEGYDLDPEPMAWGDQHNLAPLGEAASRVDLIQKDVRVPGLRRADVRCAHNFSYNVFHTRRELLEYFRAAHADLAEGGILVMDMYGGSEAVEVLEEERWVDDDFIYVWDQDEHWPGTGEHRCYIHFRFPDGSELTRAFSYDWRLWTMPEVKEALREAGFTRVLSYFEEFDDDGDGTGVFSVSDRGYACESWLAYLVAVK